MVNPQKSFFSFEKQGIRKSLKGDRTDSYQGPKFSHISITPKSAVTIEPPKKVGVLHFFLSFFLFILLVGFSLFIFLSSSLLPSPSLSDDGEVIVRHGLGGWLFGSQGRRSLICLSRSSAGRFYSRKRESLMSLRNEWGIS